MAPVKIIIKFGENNLLGQIYIHIYISFAGGRRGLHCSVFILQVLFIIHKNGKSTTA